MKVNTKLPKEKFIKKIEIVAFLDGKFEAFELEISAKGNDEREFFGSLSEGDKRLVSKRIISKKNKDSTVNSFISITLNNALSGKLGYTQYNYDTPWIFQIEFIDLKAEREKQLRYVQGMEQFEKDRAIALVNGYVMRRHKDFGEIPDFKWYNKIFNYQYSKEI